MGQFLSVDFERVIMIPVYYSGLISIKMNTQSLLIRVTLKSLYIVIPIIYSTVTFNHTDPDRKRTTILFEKTDQRKGFQGLASMLHTAVTLA